MGELFASKRFRIAVVGLIVWAGARFGLDIDAEAADKVIDLVMVLVATYGLTGLGKEKVREAAKAGAGLTEVDISVTTPPPVPPSEPPDPEAATRVLSQAARRPTRPGGGEGQ